MRRAAIDASAVSSLGIAADGTKDVLGIWIEQNKGAKF